MEAAVEFILNEIDESSSGVELLSVLNSLKDELNSNNQLFVKSVAKSKIICRLFEISIHTEEYLKSNKTSQSKCHPLHKLKSALLSSPENDVEILSLLRKAALGCIYHSCLKMDYDGENETYINSLASLLNPELTIDNSHAPYSLFQFKTSFKAAFIEEISDSEIKAISIEKVNSEVGSKLSSFYSEVKSYEPELQHLPPHVISQIPVWLCSLEAQPENSSHGITYDVADALASKGLALRRTRNKLGAEFHSEKKSPRTTEVTECKKSSVSSRHVEEIIITGVMNGNFFWMLKGKDAINSVASIHTILSEKESLQPFSYSININKVVAVKINFSGSRKLIRGRVLRIDEDSVSVFGIDIGGLYHVREEDIFILPVLVSLLSIPAQVGIGRLKGM